LSKEATGIDGLRREIEVGFFVSIFGLWLSVATVFLLLLFFFVVGLRDFVGAFDLVLEAVIRGGDVFLEDLRAANLPLFFDSSLSLDERALKDRTGNRV
jgi:hypothetical protein